MGLCSSASVGGEKDAVFDRGVPPGVATDDAAVGSDREKVLQLTQLFPTWDPEALSDVLKTCHQDIEMALKVIGEWSEADREGVSSRAQVDGFASSNTSTVPSPDVVARKAYDKYVLHHLISHSTPKSQSMTLKAASIMIARAHLAKKIVKMRKAQRDCLSSVALPPPPQRSYSEEERHAEIIRSQMSVEEKIDDGLQLLDQRMQFLSMRVIEMEDDGNCQFRALSHELFGHQRWHLFVRQKVVDWLVSNPDNFSVFVGNSDDWRQYISTMSQNRTWGDELTMRAAAEAFSVSIHVVTTEHENWLLKYNSIEGSDTDDKRQLFLCYVSPIHYNVVAPIVSE